MFTFPKERNVVLDQLLHLLLPEEDHRHLNGDLHEASSWRAFLLTETKQPVVVAGVSCETSFEECQVEDGAVEVDKLEQIALQGQGVVVVRLGSEMFKMFTPEHLIQVVSIYR